ncbi:hypothetical protein VPHF35G1_0042 [Vibrio phage F35 g1]|nr:conserved hypothetical protein [Vibrio phage 115E34-1]CAH9015422.1 conserved hypothetical protein [Vibrio phage 466E53-1]CAH9016259.1 conserved hypothetical protein [Vibrio phage 120E34-1]
MKSVTANLSYEVYVTCPHCGHNFDAISDEYSDNEGQYSKPLFNNKWDDINLIEQCQSCEGEFTVSGIEY